VFVLLLCDYYVVIYVYEVISAVMPFALWYYYDGITAYSLYTIQLTPAY